MPLVKLGDMWRVENIISGTSGYQILMNCYGMDLSAYHRDLTISIIVAASGLFACIFNLFLLKRDS
jgi:hypothetical protein